MNDFKVEGTMLVTPSGSYDIKSISSVQKQEYDMTSTMGWICYLKGAPWLLASAFLFCIAGAWNPPAILCAAFALHIIGSDYVRIKIVTSGKKYTLYKYQCGISKHWGKDKAGKKTANEIYEFITNVVGSQK